MPLLIFEMGFQTFIMNEDAHACNCSFNMVLIEFHDKIGSQGSR